jgi:hypothetical protein
LTDPGTGQLEPANVDAVVSVATSRLDEEDLKWGAGCLLNVIDGLRRRTQSERYETYVLDADEVLDGLETILAADIVENAMEDGVDEGWVRRPDTFTAWTTRHVDSAGPCIRRCGRSGCNVLAPRHHPQHRHPRAGRGLTDEAHALQWSCRTKTKLRTDPHPGPPGRARFSLR